MKKIFAVTLVLAFAVTAVFAGPVSAQRKHASKAVWRGMLAGLGDIQGIIGALAVFDMKRVSMIADTLAKREKFVSNIKRLPAKTRETHGKIAVLAAALSADAKAGNEQAIGKKVGEILSLCSVCHYHSRDKSRRMKMK